MIAPGSTLVDFGELRRCKRWQERREAAGYSRTRVGDLVGIKPGTIEGWELRRVARPADPRRAAHESSVAPAEPATTAERETDCYLAAAATSPPGFRETLNESGALRARWLVFPRGPERPKGKDHREDQEPKEVEHEDPLSGDKERHEESLDLASLIRTDLTV